MKAGILAVASMMAVAIVSAQAESATKAVAVLSPTKGNSVSGTVTFTKVDGGVKIVADVAGVPSPPHHVLLLKVCRESGPPLAPPGRHLNHPTPPLSRAAPRAGRAPGVAPLST